MSDETSVATMEPAPVAATAPAEILAVIARVASDERTDVAKMQALMEMQERLVVEQRRVEYQDALSRVQHAVPRVSKDGWIPKPKYGGGFSFAKFEDIQAIVGPLLKAEGFSTRYDEEIVEGMPGIKRVTVTLSRGGHSESCSTFVPISDPGPGRNESQAMISANSYGKRRALVNILDITMEGEDDDGAGGAKPITPDQVDELDALMAEVGANRVRFLKHIGVQKLAEILDSDFARAKTGLESERRRRNGHT